MLNFPQNSWEFELSLSSAGLYLLWILTGRLCDLREFELADSFLFDTKHKHGLYSYILMIKKSGTVIYNKIYLIL